MKKTIQIIETSSLLANDSLCNRSKFLPLAKVQERKELINEEINKRSNYEALQTRLVNGIPTVAQSPDIKNLYLLNTDAFARLSILLNIDLKRYINPQDSLSGKSATETSSLKAYKKTAELALTALTGSGKLENVIKVFTVCCVIAQVKLGKSVIERSFCEDFLSSSSFAMVKQGSEDFIKALDELETLRASHMSGGCKTQASQAIRTLVALGAGKDVINGKSKDFTIDVKHALIQNLLRRFGQAELLELTA